MAAPSDGAARSRPGAITLRDVAERSGVSITTVSRILNDRLSGVPIREETRRRVTSTAAELGYTPNLMARALRGSRSSLIGVIARDIADPFHVQVLRGIDQVARTTDYRLFLGHVDYRPEAALAYGSMFERSHADGIIVIGDLEGGDELIGALAPGHRAVVGVTDRTGPRDFPGVYGDSLAGTRSAVNHLWELGHRRIACVTEEVTSDGRLRADRFTVLLAARGVASPRVHVVASPGTPEPGLQLGRQLFGASAERRPSAIFATSDTIAIGLMQAAYEAGLELPNDLSIVGYDDIDVSAFTIPPLTTVSQAGVDMGRRAADLLLSLIAAGEPRDASDVVLEPALVVRRSTAAPAS